jgi:hypothetical protein
MYGGWLRLIYPVAHVFQLFLHAAEGIQIGSLQHLHHLTHNICQAFMLLLQGNQLLSVLGNCGLCQHQTTQQCTCNDAMVGGKHWMAHLSSSSIIYYHLSSLAALLVSKVKAGVLYMMASGQDCSWHQSQM